MEILDHHPVLEAVLSEHAGALGAARVPYAGHVYRTFNLARAVLGNSARDDSLAVISVFHDLGIWTDRTFDYLPPSLARAEAYLARESVPVSPQLVRAAIDNHHCLRAVRGGPEPQVSEAFRRADLVDVSRGLVRFGLPNSYLRELRATFPIAGFHGVLVRAAWGWFVRHPTRPLPMLRLKAR